MKFGFITGSLTSIGGGQTVVLPLASALGKLGHEVYGLQPDLLRKGFVEIKGLPVSLEPVWPQMLKSPASVAAIIRSRLYENFGDRSSKPRLTAYERLTGRALQKGIDRLLLDVIYTIHNINAALLLDQNRGSSRIFAINLIGFGIDSSRGGTANTFPYQDLIFGRLEWDLHIAATHFEYEQYCFVYEKLGLDSSKLIQLPHPFDEDQFHPAPFEGRDGKTEGEQKIILYPVNVYRRKNIELAIDSIKLLQEEWPVRLVVTGRIWDSDYLGELRDRVSAQGLEENVVFLQGVSYEELKTLYHETTVTIFTSHQETFGLGIVESLGSGTPVVGPRWIHPCREILEGSFGGWCVDKDASSFAEIIANIIAHPPNGARIADEAKRKYGSQVVALKFLEAVDGVIAKKRRFAQQLEQIDWKALYEDSGDLI